MSKFRVLVCLVGTLFLTGCGGGTAKLDDTPDEIELARLAKDRIGVSSVDELKLSNIQNISQPADAERGTVRYRYFVDSRGGSKYICSVVTVPERRGKNYFFFKEADEEGQQASKCVKR